MNTAAALRRGVFVLRCSAGETFPEISFVLKPGQTSCSRTSWAVERSLSTHHLWHLSSDQFCICYVPLLSSAWRHFLPNHSLLWDLLSARTELIQLMGQTLSICWKNGADWIQSLQTKAGKCTGRQRRFVEILVFGRGYWWRQAKDAGFALVNTKVTLQALHF